MLLCKDMKCKELIAYLEQEYPVSYSEAWDNVGLLVGSDEKEVEKVFVALDLNEETLEQALAFGADLILTHHPMIFSGIKKINNHSFLGRRILKLIQADVAYYAMHTNYDVKGMAELSGRYLNLVNPRVLSVTEDADGHQEGFGRVGELEVPMSLEEYGRYVKTQYGLEHVTVYGDLDRVIRRAAVCTGSGKSMIPAALAAGADVYVTGDIDHHTGIDTVAQGLALIDAGHYGTEYIFIQEMQKKIGDAFPQLILKGAVVRTPYVVL